MTKNFFYALAGLVAGAIIVLLTVFNLAPSRMFIESESEFAFDETVEIFTSTATDMGWKVPHVSDLQKTMAKHGHDVKKVKVIDLCHPDHAIKILEKSDERIVTPMMPCRVSIYEKADGKVYISRMNSGKLARLIGGVIEEVMTNASGGTEKILNSVIK
jgi:uncharacterized protein (DUF302 family)